MASVLLIGASVVAAVVSIREGLPARWGSGFAGPLALDGSPRDVLTGFLTWRGTAMAPPLALVLVIATLTVLAARRSRLAVGGLTLIGAVALVGYWGEPITREVLFDDFELGKASLVIVQLALSSLLIVFGLLELRTRRPRPGT
jgi:hypothetical protein